jgi:hypothetical protein
MDVNAMHRTPTTSPASSPATLFRLAMVAGAVSALSAALLVDRVPEPIIIVAVIVIASLISWQRTPLTPARVRSQHRFTVVSRFGDGFVTIDSSGARRVARRLVLDGPSS